MGRWRLHHLPWTLAPIRAVFLMLARGVKGHPTAQHTQGIPGQMIPRADHGRGAEAMAGDGPRDVGTDRVGTGPNNGAHARSQRSKLA